MALMAAVLAPVLVASPESACDATSLPTRVERALGRPPVEGDPTYEVHARVEGDRIVGTAVLSVGDRVYERELEAESCDALLDAVALLVVASAAPPSDDATLVPEPEPEPATLPGPEPATQLEPEPELASELGPTGEDPARDQEQAQEPRPEAPERDRGPPRLRPFAGVAVGGALGGVPQGTGLVRLHVAIERRWLRLALAGAYWIRRRTTADEDADRIVELGTASVLGCALFGARARAGPCLVTELGGMRADLPGSSIAQPRTNLWLSVRAGARVGLRLTPRVNLLAMADLGFAVVKPSFTVAVSDGPAFVVHEPGLLSARLFAGVELALGRRP